jgi:hypothetical protein
VITQSPVYFISSDQITIQINATFLWNITCPTNNAIVGIVEESLFELISSELQANTELDSVVVTDICNEATTIHTPVTDVSVRSLESSNLSPVGFQMQVTQSCKDCNGVVAAENLYTHVDTIFKNQVGSGKLTSTIQSKSGGAIQASVAPYTTSTYSLISNETTSPTRSPTRFPTTPNPTPSPSKKPTIKTPKPSKKAKEPKPTSTKKPTFKTSNPNKKAKEPKPSRRPKTPKTRDKSKGSKPNPKSTSQTSKSNNNKDVSKLDHKGVHSLSFVLTLTHSLLLFSYSIKEEGDCYFDDYAYCFDVDCMFLRC